MPRHIRNFWLTLEVDGRETRIATGPRTADGGFHLNIYIRREGGIVGPVRIGGYVMPDGKLEIEARDLSGQTYILARTHRNEEPCPDES